MQILSDNVTTCAYINRIGGQDVLHNSMVKGIFLLCSENRIHITAKYLQGKLNLRADQLSRQGSTYEWTLRPRMFCQLEAKWGPFSCDRFASSVTSKVKTFNSYF